MPRTKVSKTSKRNRETANREEKIREYENSLDGFHSNLEDKIQDLLTAYEYEINMLLERTPRALLKMKMVDVLSLDLSHLTDWEQQKSKMFNASLQNSILIKSRTANPNDEGYLTEDSSNSGSIGSTIANSAYSGIGQRQSCRLRTPGPLSSARARRPRRSRSACGDTASIIGSALKQKPSDHSSRCKIRTPMATRPKAVSADRTYKDDNDNSIQSPPFLRFPKAGELVLSKCGSPLVSHVQPENFAHLNIPLRNGAISLRPKKLGDVQPQIIEDIDPVTIDQLRTLKLNIDKIVSMADKAGF